MYLQLNQESLLIYPITTEVIFIGSLLAQIFILVLVT